MVGGAREVIGFLSSTSSWISSILAVGGPERPLRKSRPAAFPYPISVVRVDATCQVLFAARYKTYGQIHIMPISIHRLYHVMKYALRCSSSVSEYPISLDVSPVVQLHRIDHYS
jgi:hypothetical protein